jgi:ubiquinone/menaquinone biosynthesis C-methylase UbiE
MTKLIHGFPDRLARVYDAEVYPLLGQRFGDMVLTAVPARPDAVILEIGCASGVLTAELMHKFGGDARLVAVDGSPALLELARSRVSREEQGGRRVAFRVHDPQAVLPFDDASFDVVCANVSFGDVPHAAAMVADWVRVLRPGGDLVVAAPMRGSWCEFLDMFRDVLIRTRSEEALAALDRYIASLPDRGAMVGYLESAGLGHVDIELRQWELVFRSAREFFYAPAIEQGPLPRWKEIVGHGEAMQAVFAAVKQCIDIYMGGRPFSVSVLGGRFLASKPKAV